MKIILTCSLPYTSARTSVSTSSACSFRTASVSTFLISAGVGEDLPEDAGVKVLPFGVVAEDFSVFSIALAAVTLAPSEADGAGSSFFLGGVEGVVSTIESTFGFPTEPSPPIDNDFTTGAAGVGEAVDAGLDVGTGGLATVGSVPVGLLAIIGVFPCVGCDCCGCWYDCCGPLYCWLRFCCPYP